MGGGDTYLPGRGVPTFPGLDGGYLPSPGVLTFPGRGYLPSTGVTPFPSMDLPSQVGGYLPSQAGDVFRQEDFFVAKKKMV